MARFRGPDARSLKTGFDRRLYRYNFEMDRLLRKGELLEAEQVFEKMPQRNLVSANTMLDGYVKSGDLLRARSLFDSMIERNTVTWTILMCGYMKDSRPVEAFKLFSGMLRNGNEPDSVALASLISGSGSAARKSDVIQLHPLVLKSGYYSSSLTVCNSLLDAYFKSHHSTRSASRLFDGMSERDSVTFNVMIAGHSNRGFHERAIDLFGEMRRAGSIPTEFSFAALLSASIGLDRIPYGTQIHGCSIKNGFLGAADAAFLSNALLDFYSKFDFPADAVRLFRSMPELNSVSYNVMIARHARDGEHDEALRLYLELYCASPDRKDFPYATMLSVAANRIDLRMGKQLHAQCVVAGARSVDPIGNSLVDMYAKCGRFENAKLVFCSRSSIAWTAMISGYVENELYEEAQRAFVQMCGVGSTADQSTFASVLRASASLPSPNFVKQAHSLVIRLGFMTNVYCGSALVDAYAKSGRASDAVRAFLQIPEKNAVSWNAVISAGSGEEALASLEKMEESGQVPDSVTFLNVLSACGHSGMIRDGLRVFGEMSERYGVVPGRRHYASVVDMLCRGGRFIEAEKLMLEMPFFPDEILWSSVLNACRIHKNVALARKAAGNLFGMEPRDASSYVTMANICASAGDWEGAGALRKASRNRGLRKVAACSWVELRDRVHVFSSNGTVHPQTVGIMRAIDLLMEKVEGLGHETDADCALHDTENCVKKESLRYHSERLAIAFALMNTPEGSPIIVMKNLRSCPDCHAAIKVISKIVGRLITVRDSSRFHHFRQGNCSCQDYW